MLAHALDLMKPKIQYRINFQNSNGETIVGSEWADCVEDLAGQFLYLSNQGYFCKIQKSGEQ